MSIGVLIVLFCNVVLSTFGLDEPFHQMPGMSFHECDKKCDDNAICLSVRYLRRFSLCKMYDVLLDESIKEPGIQVIRKTTKNITECNGACVKEMCSVPRVAGADRVGNLYSFGSRVKFTCRETPEVSEIVTCLPGGYWSNNTLYCKCRNPGQLVNGEFGPLLRFNDSHVTLNASCNGDYVLHELGKILCEIETGLWHGLDNFCCDILQSEHWTKIYSSPKNYKQGIVNLIQGKEEIGVINTCTTGFFRNKTILSNWKNHTIQRINLTVISNDEIVAYMLFSANATTNMSWFSIKRLINSSWSDLTPTTSVDRFNIVGFGRGFRRWFVAQTASKNATDDTCLQDIGWFVVTWDFYPCGNDVGTGHRILYAKNGVSSTFTQGEIGVADKFEVWIEQ